MKKTLTLLSIFLSLSTYQAAEASDNYYEKLSIKLEESKTQTFHEVLDGSTVVFHANFRSEEEKDFVVNKTREYIRLAKKFKRQDSTSCLNVEEVLHVYFIPRSIINDRGVMNFLVWNKWGNKNIMGAFDSVRSPAGTVSIFVSSSHSREDIDITIKHEVYHYWQHKTCEPISEKPAYEFEHFHGH